MRTKLCNFISIDIGSSKIAAIASYVENNGHINIISQSLYYSEGIKSGIVTNFKKAENSIISAIYSLEKDCGKTIKQATISVPGLGTKSYYVYTKIRVSNQNVTKQDIIKLISKALYDFKIKDQEIIHYFPIEFTLDDNHAIQDPIGMYGRELGCRLHLVSANSSMLLNLVNCLSKCQVEVDGIVLAIYASGLSCLSEDEKNLGALIIDIGAKTTSFGVFFNDKLLYTNNIPIGGWHITSDIAKVLSVSFQTAEKLKVLYGNAVESIIDRDNIINLEDIDPEASYINSRTTLSAAYLSEIIRLRAEEILGLIKAEYDKIGVDHLIARCIVLTGGGALLRGLKELTSKIFDKHTRIGKPQLLPGFVEDYNPSIYSTAVGIIRHYANKQEKSYINAKDSDNLRQGWFKQALLWLKENI